MHGAVTGVPSTVRSASATDTAIRSMFWSRLRYRPSAMAERSSTIRVVLALTDSAALRNSSGLMAMPAASAHSRSASCSRTSLLLASNERKLAYFCRRTWWESCRGREKNFRREAIITRA